MTQPLSIAYLSPGWPADAVASGVATCVTDMAHGLRRAGHLSHVLTKVFDENKPEWVHDLSGGGPRTSLAYKLVQKLLYRVDADFAMHHDACRRILAMYHQVDQAHGIDVLELEEAFGWSRRIQPRIPAAVVVRLHGPWFMNGLMQGGVPGALLDRRIRVEGESIALADGVSSPSLDVLERTRRHYGLPLEDAVVIPNPAPVVPRERRWSASGSDLRTVLFIGRFDTTKGGDVVIRAFARVARERPELRLCFVGPDVGLTDKAGRRWQIREYLAEHAPGSPVEFLGKRPLSELPELRRRSFITVVGSRYETFGLTVVEAMAHGCPLVATRAGGIPEILRDGENALLCETENHEAMAAAVGRLAADPDLAARLGGLAGEDASTRYHPDAIARESLDFYRRVIERRGRASGRSAPDRRRHPRELIMLKE